ncbi:MAG: hypothetical protein ACYTG3_21560, partial [Planctomycetota bacterium]
EWIVVGGGDGTERTDETPPGMSWFPRGLLAVGSGAIAGLACAFVLMLALGGVNHGTGLSEYTVMGISSTLGCQRRSVSDPPHRSEADPPSAQFLFGRSGVRGAVSPPG